MVSPIFTANGGHLGFSDFYGSDFDRLLVIYYIQGDRKQLRNLLLILFGVRVVIYMSPPVS